MMCPWPTSPLTRMVGASRIPIEPSFVSPIVTWPFEAWMVTSKSMIGPSGVLWNRWVRVSVQMTLPSGAIHLFCDLMTPTSVPELISRNLSWTIFPLPSAQKSTPLTAPCVYHSDLWCGWSWASFGPSPIGQWRIIGAPVGPITG